ncbi:MAG TPA: TonB-dependent receptor [Opitutaceae bacterium]|nr:TonB-dependent receptor [Opitutaceae bacterium]
MPTDASSAPKELLTTGRKALTVNLDAALYGTFAEIGAGQEVARHFFQVGGAAGTVAKTISAYDMTFSDAIYGKAPRYVSRERLATMLDHEYALLAERLGTTRGPTTRFFVFADTVAARNYKGTNECHGWMGVRFQIAPGDAPNDVIIHVRMWDKENVLQQQALGIIGVNLLYGVAYLHQDPRALVASLADNLGTDRIEVDMVQFSGPAFAHVDNRLLSLFLVEYGLTNAVLLSPSGAVLQPSEVLRKKSVLVERGSFRPVTNVNLDMLRCAGEQFARDPAVGATETIVLAELTVHNLRASGALDAADFLARADLLGAVGLHVLVSNYALYFRLIQYFRRYTQEPIGVVLGINALLGVLDEKYYEDLPGGILESIGRLFREAVRLYVYPMHKDALAFYCELPPPAGTGDIYTSANLQVAPHLRHLYAHLLENRHVVGVTNYDPVALAIPSRDIVRRIHNSDPGWDLLVPPEAVALIRQRHLFGCVD